MLLLTSKKKAANNPVRALEVASKMRSAPDLIKFATTGKV